MHRLFWMFLVCIGAHAACSPAPSAPAAAPTAPAAPPTGAVPAAPATDIAAHTGLDPAQAAALDRAKAAAQALGGALRAQLQDAMAAGGPPAGVEACVDAAPRLTAVQAAGAGVSLGRSSLRLRSPANAGPDWVQSGLQTWGERAVAGLSPQISLHTDEKGEFLRLLLPIGIEPQCTACHGAAEAQPAALRAILAARYPADRALGYAAGDLRGGLWVEAKVQR